MAADLNQLVPVFRKSVKQLIANCKAKGVEMRPYATVRDPYEQARLWRQSRSKQEIAEKIRELKNDKAPFLANCIESVGPRHGDPVTNAIPGLSWHQWGEAVDCFWVVDGKAEWSLTRLVGGVNGYKVMAEEAKALGLDAGLLWKSFKDAPHVQMRSLPSPLAIQNIAQISAAMDDLFGELTP